MSDLIDREALLKQIDIDSEGEPGYYGDTWKFIDTIKKMPSALSTNLAEVGTDCISRQQAIDDIWTVSPLARLDRKWVDRWLRQLPPIQPDIVKCKDCKHFEYDYVAKVNGIPLIVAHEICMRWGDGVATSENGYCFLAERRKVET